MGLVVLSASAAPTPPADPAVDTSDEVSWQSAFWALVPIALNSMTQPAGRVLGMPSKYSFYLNSSPIVCMGNALEIVSKLCWRTYDLNSVDAAAHWTAKEIFEDVERPEPPTELEKLQENRTVRLCIFILGALPQVIKLYAMRGIVGTKVCASMYLSSFLVIEAAMRWLERYRTDSRGQDDQAKHGHGSAIALRVFIVCTCQGVSDFLALTTGSTVYFSLRGLFLVTIASVASTFVLCGTIFELPRFLSPSEVEQDLAFFLLRSLCVALLSGMPVRLGLPRPDHDIGTALNVTYVMMMKPAIPMGFVYVGRKFDVMVKRWGKSGLTQYEGLPLLFMLLQLFTGIHYYIYIYDSKCTSKPAWTNQLG
ncbi:hypothetical protein G7Y79_00041g077540 [Physcia stellaris]|nr:hypothetical protein G7Y79_00041g077540 [Physcia stellaris]